MPEGMEHMHHAAAPGFAELWSPAVFIFAVLVGALYFYLIGPGRARFADSGPVEGRKKFYMISALLTFYIGQGSPLAYYGHHELFSAHMMQQSLLYLLMPPLIYLALPVWMVQPLFSKAWMKKWVRPLTNPLFAVFLFNMLFSIYHIPMIFDSTMSNPYLHYGYHAMLMITAFHMWFPIFCPVPEWNRLSSLSKLGYIFVDGVLLTPACACIIFANSIIYQSYAHSGQLGLLSAYEDQQLGGTVMKIMQEIIYGFALAYIFFKWYRSERKKEEESAENEEMAYPVHQLPSH